LDGLEKQVDRNVGTTTIPVTLDEIATGARVAYAAENSGGKIVFIGDPMAEMAVGGTRKRIVGGLKKAAENG
jgi:hypothetical protein